MLIILNFLFINFLSPFLQGECRWTQVGDVIYGENEGDESGISVSLNTDGSIVAIGGFMNDVEAASDNENSGHVRIYKRDGAKWTQLGDETYYV